MLPLTFSTSLSGTTMTLTIRSAANYGANVTNFDIQFAYDIPKATYVSTAGGTGYTTVGNGATAGTVILGGFDSTGGTGLPAGSVLATVNFTLKMAISDFPLTLTNTSLNDDAPASGSADPSVPCFVKGTRLLTQAGDVAVEALQVGDRVVTVDGSTSAVRWIGQRRIVVARRRDPHNVQPVRIHAGAMAPGVPSRDVLLSPDHAVFVDGSLIPVRYLLNGATVVQESWSEVTYVHIELERHAVMLADGLPAESYLDSGNRAAFQEGVTNVAVIASGSQPEALAVWARDACAPLVHSGPALEQARRRFLDRAQALGHAITVDANIHLVADGRVLRGRATAEGVAFTVPSKARSVRLRSRSFVPAHLLPDSIDTRRLGVAVSSVLVDGVAYRPGDAPGWYAAEPGLQWTDGDASLDGVTGKVLVSAESIGVYWAADPGTTDITRAA